MNRWKKNRAPFYTSKPSDWTFYFEIKKFMLKWTFAQFKRSYGQKDNWHMAFQTIFKSSCDSTKICCPQPNIICSLKAVPNHHCLNHREKKSLQFCCSNGTHSLIAVARANVDSVNRVHDFTLCLTHLRRASELLKITRSIFPFQLINEWCETCRLNNQSNKSGLFFIAYLYGAYNETKAHTFDHLFDYIFD